MSTEVKQERQGRVWIVSHGPDCLDGVTSAVVVTRYLSGRKPLVRFASNRDVQEVLGAVPPPVPGDAQELWITDLSWSDQATEKHLRMLAGSGTSIYWIDHHQSAIERWERGEVAVPLAGRILSSRFAASRLAYEYLSSRLPAGQARESFRQLERLVMLADDNDRWVHAHAGSRELALTVATMDGAEAYEELLGIDAEVSYTKKMEEAWRKVSKLLAESRELAGNTREEELLGGIRLVTASCSGYPSEIADDWGRKMPCTVFALYDARSDGVSFRRSPDCKVDLARLAEQLGGGGHAAAAGCEMAGLTASNASELLQQRVAPVLAALIAEGRGCPP